MKQKFKLLLAALFLASFAATPALAADAKVAILDIEKIAKESKAVQDIQAKVSKKQEDYQKEINKKQTALESEQKRIEGKKNTFSKEALEKEQKEFAKKVDELKTFVDKKQATLKKASTDAMAKVNDKMKDIIADIAKDKNLNIILPSSQVVFAADELDISAEVLEKLNNKVTKIDVKFE